MINEIIIRSASNADIKEIAKMQINALKSDDFNQFYHSIMNLFIKEFEKRWKKQINQSTNVMLMLKSNKIIGFITYLNSINSDIKNIYILPSMRRKGLGSMLCKAVIEELLKSKSKKISVWILKENNKAKLFFEKLGFKQTLQSRSDDIGHRVQIKEIQYHLIISECSIQ